MASRTSSFVAAVAAQGRKQRLVEQLSVGDQRPEVAGGKRLHAWQEQEHEAQRGQEEEPGLVNATTASPGRHRRAGRPARSRRCRENSRAAISRMSAPAPRARAGASTAPRLLATGGRGAKLDARRLRARSPTPRRSLLGAPRDSERSAGVVRDSWRTTRVQPSRRRRTTPPWTLPRRPESWRPKPTGVSAAPPPRPTAAAPPPAMLNAMSPPLVSVPDSEFALDRPRRRSPTSRA